MTPMQIAARRHRDANMLISGTLDAKTPEGFNGRSVGCFAHDIDEHSTGGQHSIVAEHYGVPEWVVRLQDAMFEGLPAGERGNWHVQIADAYAEVTDWPRALHRVHAAILKIAEDMAGAAAPVVRAVRELHEREETDPAAWSAARSAARSAAWSAAESAVFLKLRDAILAALPTPKERP